MQMIGCNRLEAFDDTFETTTTTTITDKKKCIIVEFGWTVMVRVIRVAVVVLCSFSG